MIAEHTASPREQLPVTRQITLAYALSLVVALLMAGASVAGIAYGALIYPTEELRHWSVLTDAVNLVAGLPLLLGSMWLARRRRLIGLLSWLGVLFSALYLYVPYVLSVPFGPAFLPHVLSVSLSACALLVLVSSIDGKVLRERLAGILPARLSAGVLIVLGVFMLLRQVALILSALETRVPVPASELAIWVDDLTIACPALLAVGVQLWRKRPLGYVGGPGLLLAYGLLALGLVPGLATSSPAEVEGIITVLIMAAICLAPLAVSLRRASRSPVPQDLTTLNP